MWSVYVVVTLCFYAYLYHFEIFIRCTAAGFVSFRYSYACHMTRHDAMWLFDTAAID